MEHMYDYFYAFGAILVALYASKTRITPPPHVKSVFQHPLFQILFLFMIAIVLNKDPGVGIIVAIAFVTTLRYAQQSDLNEDCEYFAAAKKLASHK